MGVEIQKFREQFSEVKPYTFKGKLYDLYSYADKNLDKFIETYLFQSNMILRNWDMIKDIVLSLKEKMGQFAAELGSLEYLEDQKAIWAKVKHIEANPNEQELEDAIINRIREMWGENALHDQIILLTDKLVDILRNEVNFRSLM